MRARALLPHERDRYEALARRNGSIFATLRWLDLFGGRARPVGLFDEGDHLVGGFTCYQERRLGLRLVRTPPYTASIGPFFCCDASNPAAIAGIHKRVSDAMRQYFDQHASTLLMLTLDPGHLDVQPFLWNGYTAHLSYTYRLDIRRPVDALWAGMSSERRKSIRRVEKDGLRVELAPDLEDVRRLAVHRLRGAGKNPYADVAARLVEHFAPGGDTFGFAAWRDGETRPIAGVLCVHDSRATYYVMGGYDPGQRHHGAMAACLWQAILRARRLGHEVFDFEGSSVPEIERFFRGFGGTLSPVPVVLRATAPIRLALGLLGRVL